MRSTCFETSQVVAATPPFEVSFAGKSFARASRCFGSFFIFEGLVRLEWRNVPPVRSTVRVFSRVSGST